MSPYTIRTRAGYAVIDLLFTFGRNEEPVSRILLHSSIAELTTAVLSDGV
jgi:hypothetical protein